jgi:thiamine pyrophosphate-dependent acetolactate synthase large subunit-like protein
MNESRPDIDRVMVAAPADTQWGSDHIADVMRALDIEYLALTPGASFRGLHDSLVNYLGNVRPAMLLALHEESAVAIAHGYAKVTGKPLGVVLHSNVGLLHASMAIFNAWCERVPMLIYGGNGPMDASSRPSLGRLDAHLYRPGLRSSAITSSGTTSRHRSPRRQKPCCGPP